MSNASSGVSMKVPPSGGSLEIGNDGRYLVAAPYRDVPPSGGSLEIGNHSIDSRLMAGV